MFNFITRKYKNGISIRSRYIVLIKIKKKIVKQYRYCKKKKKLPSPEDFIIKILVRNWNENEFR